MNNIFFVGNGFDLHHKFPTGYINFLHVVQFLVENSGTEYSTVGEVLGNKLLHKKDPFIAECYEKHADIYETTMLVSEQVIDIIVRAESNIWFQYLCKCVERDIRWIDFEKEIMRVIEAFNAFFDYSDKLILHNGKIMFDFFKIPENREDRYILSQFNFFFEELHGNWGAQLIMRVKDEYVGEHVVGSNTYYIAVDRIISSLYCEVRKLAEILRDYLLCFIDGPAKEYSKAGIKPVFQGLPISNRVFSFNYTNTFEILYKNEHVDHIHGNTETNIVLGINPDEKDEIYHVDTTFLQFKKYFQRTFFKTDDTFLKQIAYQKRTPQSANNHIWVIGHSLDSTDEDVIKQTFDSAKQITVLYHCESVVKDYITHLVEIYGKEGVDRLRLEKGLTFISQEDIRWEVK